MLVETTCTFLDMFLGGLFGICSRKLCAVEFGKKRAEGRGIDSLMLIGTTGTFMVIVWQLLTCFFGTFTYKLHAV